jgi:hypothetical protein
VGMFKKISGARNCLLTLSVDFRTAGLAEVVARRFVGAGLKPALGPTTQAGQV